MALNILIEPPYSSLIILTSLCVMVSPLRGRHVTKGNRTYAPGTRTGHLEIALETGSMLCQIPIQEWRFGGRILDQHPAKPSNIKLIGS